MLTCILAVALTETNNGLSHAGNGSTIGQTPVVAYPDLLLSILPQFPAAVHYVQCVLSVDVYVVIDLPALCGF